MQPDADLPQYDRPPGLTRRIAEAMGEAHAIPTDEDELDQFLRDRHTAFMELAKTWENKSC